MKKESGITLVALIITVIILLVLATVSINLIINSGVITKSKTAVDKYSEEEIGEQIKLAYLECQTEKLSNSNVNEENFIRDSLKEKLNDNDLNVQIKNGKVIVNTTVKGEPKTYIYKSSTGVAYKYVDPFNYGGKEKKDLVPGDDISIGTENFRVFYNQDGVIKAMPWYNIESKLDNPKQSVSAERIEFSSTNYWTEEENWTSKVDEINMKNPNNNIQKYISAYEKTLNELGAEKVDVRVARGSELNSSIGVTNEMRNPKNSNNFWLGSGDINNSSNILFVAWNGAIVSLAYNTDKYNGYNKGVRPIIVIEY